VKNKANHSRRIFNKQIILSTAGLAINTNELPSESKYAQLKGTNNVQPVNTYSLKQIYRDMLL